MSARRPAERSPKIIFSRIRDTFRARGLLGSPISVEYAGCAYRISCDESHFMVYRVSENSHLRHHVPGWPVCLVNTDTIFEECSVSGLATDHCACDVTVEKWLEIIESSPHGASEKTPVRQRFDPS
jgi:hypothetical protein